MVFIDVLDVWSLFVVLIHSRREKTVYYLSSPVGFLGIITRRLLTFLGFRVCAMNSYFENRPFKEYYIEFYREMLDLVHGRIYRTLNEQVLESKSFCGWERERVVRFLALKANGIILRAFELIKTIKHKEPVSDCLILVQHSEYFPVLLEYSRELKGSLQYYRSPFRLRFKRRSAFEIDVDYESHSPSSILYDLLKSSILLSLSVCFSVWSYIIHKLKRSCPDGTGFNHDIVYLTSRKYDPTPVFNDVYWMKYLRSHQRISTVVIANAVLSDAAKEYYGKQCDRLFSIKFPFIDAPGSHIVWPQIARQYFMSSIASIWMCIRHLLMRRLSGRNIVYLLRLLPLVCFYKSLLQAVAARIVWCSDEAHTIDSQALAIAAASLDVVTIGSSWSLRYTPGVYASMNRNDVLFAWGKRQIDMILESDALVRRYVECGYPTIGSCLNDNELSDEIGLVSRSSSGSDERRRIVTFYDQVCAVDIIINCKELSAMYNAILDWAESEDSNFLIIKTKRDDYRKLGKAMCDRIDGLEKKGDVFVRNDYGDLVGLISDAVIGVSSSSLGCVVSAHGVPGVFYDWHGVMDSNNWPLDLDNVFIVKDTGDISSAIEKALNFKRDKKPVNGGNVDAFADSKGDVRTISYIECLHKALSEGKTSVGAIEYADKEYGRKWGWDRVHIVK